MFIEISSDLGHIYFGSGASGGDAIEFCVQRSIESTFVSRRSLVDNPEKDVRVQVDTVFESGRRGPRPLQNRHQRGELEQSVHESEFHRASVRFRSQITHQVSDEITRRIRGSYVACFRYYHFGEEREDVTQTCDKCMNDKAEEQEGAAQNDKINKKISHMTLEEGDTKPSPWCNSCKADIKKLESTMPGISDIRPTLNLTDSPGCEYCRHCGVRIDGGGDDEAEAIRVGDHGDTNESGLYLYIDLHGHASKKGIFMYGNYFEEVEKSVECMLLPKLMSLNNHNFHFNSCNFSERNMFLK